MKEEQKLLQTFEKRFKDMKHKQKEVNMFVQLCNVEPDNLQLQNNLLLIHFQAMWTEMLSISKGHYLSYTKNLSWQLLQYKSVSCPQSKLPENTIS